LSEIAIVAVYLGQGRFTDNVERRIVGKVLSQDCSDTECVDVSVVPGFWVRASSS
jgi:hypothetical protein